MWADYANIGRLQLEIAERRNNCPLVSDVKDNLTAHIVAAP